MPITKPSYFARISNRALHALSWRAASLSSKFGFDSRRILALRHYRKYQAQYKEFESLGGKITNKYRILIDYDDQAGAATGHYFHQDLLVASFIHSRNPTRHVDIGSRIDGFVAHVASFRQVDVIDVRALKETEHKNISFIRADLMNRESAPDEITDSISCLHAIEHFGLGRYGDPLDPVGHIKGFNNMVRMLKPGGMFYISFPIGKANEVHFNAHRVFHPEDIFSWAPEPSQLQLERFDYVNDSGDLVQDVKLGTDKIDVVHGCGIYSFRKL